MAFEENEMLVTVKDVAERLNDLGIKYMVTGSFAMSAYAKARTTMDIDVVLEISSTDAKRFERRFLGDYYVDELSIVNADRHKSMFNIINNATLIKVDCIVRKKDPFEVEKFARRRLSESGGVEFWVIGKEDLILSKLKWAAQSHSERQFEDIRNLLEARTDEDAIRNLVLAMGLEDVWKAFEEWKIRVTK